MMETELIRLSAPGNIDISLGVIEIRGERADRSLPPVLLVHGATFAAALFDLPLPGYSLMKRLAKSGRNVYAVDVRGFGYSLNGAAVSKVSAPFGQFPSLGEATADIGAAVELILARERCKRVDMIGFSWGAVTSANYAGQYPERIARLVLYAPLYGEKNDAWLNRIADSDDPNRLRSNIGLYRYITLKDVIERWDIELPTDDPSLYREPCVPMALFEALSALDPGVHVKGETAFRCPSGALVDMVKIFNGEPLIDPRRLTMPILIVRGSEDRTATDSDARQLWSAICSNQKCYRVIAPGSHFLVVERNRSELYEELDNYLGPFNQ